ncbi:MAG: GNAT family N-acetyltransferase [Gammaproteobacteria bacterium]|nr:GNAT family N-acetyltransferase [Gammaproteobacteria bacterium]
MLKPSSQLSRSLYVLTAGPAENCRFINSVVKGTGNQALWLTDNVDAVAPIPAVTFRQAAGLLGQEKKVVVVEVSESVHPDSLAAVSGLIVGGGCLILSLPPRELWDTVFTTRFAKRLLQFLVQSELAHFIEADDHSSLQLILQSLKQICNSAQIELTSDQQNVINTINTLPAATGKQALVVISDRGRGKSTSLGIAAAQLLTAGVKKVLITAPRFKACEVAFDYAKKNLPETKIKQAAIHYEQSEFKFMAPDEILAGQYDADILLVDEAASIPLPILKQLLTRFEKTVFVSTVHGYEGTGRGFSVRFTKVLTEQVADWQQIEMKQPVRWRSNDELEAWLFKWLCLDADVEALANDICLQNISIRQITQADLMDDEPLLRQVFALLVLAHYKTRPSDLQRLLDDKITITIAEADTGFVKQIIGIVLSADEGGFDAQTASAIYRGERRPQGHLLAQTLSYHCGVEEAASAVCHRIMRIVVHPQWQSHGLGTRLIAFLHGQLNHRTVDILGSSFGLTAELENFWQNNNFELVRIGLTKEQSSGERAAVYVRPLSDKGTVIIEKAANRFVSHFPLLQQTVLKGVDKNIISHTDVSMRSELSQGEYEDILSFVSYSRAYELCIGGVNKWLNLHLTEIRNEENSKFTKVIENVLLHKTNWKNLANKMSLDGKKQARALFKQAVVYFWNKFQ